MSSRRDDLIRACETNDQHALAELGWTDVLEALDSWWAPRQRCTPAQATPFAKLLGAENPADVLSALEELTDVWRPTPAAVRGHLRKARSDRTALGRDRHGNPATRPDVIARVAQALDNGAQPCQCGAPASRTWRVDHVEKRSDKDGRPVLIPLGVWRCPDCDGIEQGQVHAVEDEQQAVTT